MSNNSSCSFFTPSKSLSLKEIAELGGLTLYRSGDTNQAITTTASLKRSHAEALVYIADKKYIPLLAGLRAGAVLCSEEFIPYIAQDIPILLSDKPAQKFAQISAFYYPMALKPQALLGQSDLISKNAIIDPDAQLEHNITVEAGAIIGKNAEIGRDTIICAGATIAANCKIGRNCYIGPGSRIQHSLIGDNVYIHANCCLGQDGFGFFAQNGEWQKIVQLGRVIIQDKVEIGANTTIDRGTLDDTIIGEGTKIDNLVQIAHNVQIGRHCLIAAHSGIAGSVTIGDYAILGGGVGLRDHLTIGEKVQIAAASGVMNDIPAGEIWAGIPAQPLKKWLRSIATLRGLIKNKK